MTTPPARPTIRCLILDLADRWPAEETGTCLREGRLPGPHVRLDALEHALLVHARLQFDPATNAPTERVAELDDRVWLKVKPGASRWRGAATVLDERPWVGAAGWREEGSRDDFYAELGRACRAAAKGSHAAAKANTAWLLPEDTDHKRLALEQAYESSYVTPVLELQAMLADAVRHADTWVEGLVASTTVRIRIEQASEGYLHLDIHPSRVAGVLHAIDTLLLPLASPEHWDIYEVREDDRTLYFGALGSSAISRALTWKP